MKPIDQFHDGLLCNQVNEGEALGVDVAGQVAINANPRFIAPSGSGFARAVEPHVWGPVELACSHPFGNEQGEIDSFFDVRKSVV